MEKREENIIFNLIYKRISLDSTQESILDEERWKISGFAGTNNCSFLQDIKNLKEVERVTAMFELGLFISNLLVKSTSDGF